MIEIENRKLTKEEAKAILEILFKVDVNWKMSWATDKERARKELTVKINKGKVGEHTIDLWIEPGQTWHGWELTKRIYIDGKRRYSKTLAALFEDTYNIW